jgi:hypothetical protein
MMHTLGCVGKRCSWFEQHWNQRILLSRYGSAGYLASGREQHLLLTHQAREPTGTLDFHRLKSSIASGRAASEQCQSLTHCRCQGTRSRKQRGECDAIEMSCKLQCRTLQRMYGVCESRDGLSVYYGSLRAVCKGTCITAYNCRDITIMDVSLAVVERM